MLFMVISEYRIAVHAQLKIGKLKANQVAGHDA